MAKILKFSTPSCKYCKITSPQVDEYASKNGIEVEDINAEADVEASSKYEVMSVPTLVFLDEAGNTQEVVTGAEDIMKKLFG